MRELFWGVASASDFGGVAHLKKSMLMKIITISVLFLACWGCGQHHEQEEVARLQGQIDSLQALMTNAYTPGFGEFMAGIQAHHAKLWLAGINENWALADFEIHEMEEGLEDLQKYNADRPEMEKLGMITPALDSVTYAVQVKELALFKTSFATLTQTCNNCHAATDHAFNVVTIPETSPFPNQDFRVKSQ